MGGFGGAGNSGTRRLQGSDDDAEVPHLSPKAVADAIRLLEGPASGAIVETRISETASR
jgi:hypothetical protein